MKKHLNFIVLGCLALLVTSCYEPTPNDRASYNIYGAVKSIEMYESGNRNNTTVIFTESGYFSKDDNTSESVPAEISRAYLSLSYTYKEGLMQDFYSYTFDEEGRLKTIVHMTGTDSTTVTENYKYSAESALPESKSVTKEVPGSNPELIADGSIQYNSVDQFGNWTEAIWNGKTYKRNISYYDTPSVEPNCPTEKSIDWEKVGSVTLAILFLLALLFATGHMIYTLFFRIKHSECHSKEEFARLRAEKSMPEADESANQKAREMLENMESTWTIVDEEDRIAPMSIKVIRQSEATLQEIVSLAPSDEDLINEINETARVLNFAMSRKFDGSKTFIIVSLIMGIVLGFASGAMNIFILILISSAVYILASMSPEFMRNRKILEGKGGKRSFMTRVFGGLFGMVAAAKTYKTVTKWSDGSTTTDTDNSETWISLVIMLVAMIVLATLMTFIALISYLRNYVIYR